MNHFFIYFWFNKKTTIKNEEISFISIFIFLAILATAFVLFTAGKELEKTESEKPQVLSMTASVEIPGKMTFAGEGNCI